MKVKILSAKLKTYWYNDLIGQELIVKYGINNRINRYQNQFDLNEFIREEDAVITELPESFSVKRGDDNKKWNKYIKWLNKTYGSEFDGNHWECYGIWENRFYCEDKPFGTEIHIDDMIKHIDYMERLNTKYVDANGEPFVIGAWYKLLNSPTVEYRKCCKLPNNDSLVYLECITGISVGKYFSSGAYGCTSSLYRLRRVEDSEVEKYLPKEEFDLTTNEGRLAYARKTYPIGCLVKTACGLSYKVRVREIDRHVCGNIKLQTGGGLLYDHETGKWAEIIKEEVNMEKQKLSRQGLKEIHGVACPNWKDVLEHYGSRNPLEDYIELTQEEVNNMFNACTKDQLPIVSKYLKQDDGSVDVTKFNVNGKGFYDSALYVIRDREMGKYSKKSFLLGHQYNWEIKTDEFGQLCLIPTKKK